ncbi:phenylacetate-CoA oxygenase subunit PaaC [Anoxybacillus rupiensis]|uniref:Phenylacetate-CoA oxygenase subunit PaaC n=1 Tax=Anoxybacteroides rupiense TaxID=311460 RepID=A0ABD5IYK2_9BACL|nr:MULTISPECIES: 1,2-phenylacetyl-CoA epoxidase subunit PaaC [Anoxybacillus]MBS2770901.1 phenylacetate-CoA oxygenase subunit PaaC [Anoxybacillus rupiensis]MDE8563586.1 phenylacetate-CoA oxygenase subunit PaaC [Anoxybacillus rupiensis]MED5052918.1 phenylacetate-CoA oxygenase subunit PaaC [Anoxybacillus rupiensis]QHC04375.1 phenylacetate-CoA oxygenase subunit PaaC [Anoxybacillus sp. PDR2]
MEGRDSAMKITKPEELKQYPEYQEALVELLFQLADDDFILAYRGSEWLGLAPHIEEDVAFSSISQDTMGHAAMYYQLLEEIGMGRADDLAHGREASERRNAILLEEVNGPGHYLQEPRYDWAFTVVRNYFYAQAKKVRIDSLKNCSYEPLAQVAIKINMELYYHLMHWKTWFVQLVNAQGEARERMIQAIEKVMDDFGGVLSLGNKGSKMVEFGLIDSEEVLTERWIQAMKPVFEQANLTMPNAFQMKRGNGRNGEHTSDLESAIATLSEVYRMDPLAAW